ncbi:MAG: hypothetical protein Hals2KO_38750 [Halioglobus sp.]
MTSIRKSLLALIVLGALGVQSAHADLIYDEAVAGDLSDDNLAPSLIPIVEGSTIVTGSTTASPLDRDIFTFNIPAGQELVAVILQAYIAGDDQSFFAVAEGPTIASLLNPAALLGNALIGATPGAMQGDDVLDDLGALTFPGSTGFSGPLGPGTYTFWIQETTVGIREYALDFQVRSSTVPLPSTILLLITACALLRRKPR